MKQFLAIAIYRCLIEGESTRSLDLQVRHFRAPSADAVRRLLGEAGPEAHKNDAGETVLWELRAIMAVEEFVEGESGDEVVGFIAEMDEFEALV